MTRWVTIDFRCGIDYSSKQQLMETGLFSGGRMVFVLLACLYMLQRESTYDGDRAYLSAFAKRPFANAEMQPCNNSSRTVFQLHRAACYRPFDTYSSRSQWQTGESVVSHELLHVIVRPHRRAASQPAASYGRCRIRRAGHPNIRPRAAQL